MTTLAVFTLLAPLAFVTGFALQKGNICSVLAAREIVQTGKYVRLRGLLLTSGWALVFLLPLTWLAVGPFKLSPQFAPSILTIVAGALYAIGCYLTGACIFGICSRTTAGHISFAFAIPAMAVGATVGQQLGLSPLASEKSPALASDPGPLLVLLWLAIALWLVREGVRVSASHRRAGISFRDLIFQARWRSSFAALFIGIVGSLLFATNAAWFYPAAAKRTFVYVIGLSDTVPLDSIVGGLAVYAGAVTAALLNGRAVFRPPHLIPTVQALIGGFVIGFAWALIPGGNDSMVLYLLPSLALNGVVAYGVMFATLIVLEHFKAIGWL